MSSQPNPFPSINFKESASENSTLRVKPAKLGKRGQVTYRNLGF